MEKGTRCRKVRKKGDTISIEDIISSKKVYISLVVKWCLDI